MTEPSITSAPTVGTARSGSATCVAREELEHELLTDPCHLLRRACQIADYGAAADTPRSAQTPSA